MPTLQELEGQFLKWFVEDGHDMFQDVPTFAEAHGIRFLCPKSFALNHGPVGTHMIQLYFSGSPVPPHLGLNKDGQTVRWNASGNSLGNLSLTPSVQEQDDICAWHGFVGSNGVPAGSAS